MMTSQKILIVDDEPLVARSMQKTLSRAGYLVEMAHACPDGLRLFIEAQGAGQPFDLALLDLNMPGFEGEVFSAAGLDLLSKLLEIRPGLPVVILTAYDEVNKAREALARGARGFFVKGREQLLIDQVRSIFQGEAP
jgi:DNA-binding NarL/FixJ family response regulator